MAEEELITGADAARLLDVKRSEITNYEKRGKLPVAREDWQGHRRQPWYRRSDVMKIAEYRQAREQLNAPLTEGA
jgi:hypothetical protein